MKDVGVGVGLGTDPLTVQTWNVNDCTVDGMYAGLRRAALVVLPVAMWKVKVAPAEPVLAAPEPAA